MAELEYAKEGKILEMEFTMIRNPIIQLILTAHRENIILKSLADKYVLFDVKLDGGLNTKQLMVFPDNTRILIYAEGTVHKMNLFPTAQEECYPYLTHSIALHALKAERKEQINACMKFLRNYYSHQYGMNIINIAGYKLNA